MGVANYKSRLSKTCSFIYTYNISFRRIVIEKSPGNKQQIFEKRVKNFDFDEGHNYLYKKIDVVAYAKELPTTLSVN